MIEIHQVIRAVREHQARSGNLPIKIKVNQGWLDKQVAESNIEFKNGTKNIYSTLYGIPLEIDNNIRDLQLIYHEEHMRAVEEHIYEEAMKKVLRYSSLFQGDEFKWKLPE